MEKKKLEYLMDVAKLSDRIIFAKFWNSIMEASGNHAYCIEEMPCFITYLKFSEDPEIKYDSVVMHYRDQYELVLTLLYEMEDIQEKIKAYDHEQNQKHDLIILHATLTKNKPSYSYC